MPVTEGNKAQDKYSAAFGAYLRTGLWNLVQKVELKYNHNHDPNDGRFTFGSGGSSYTGGGGSNGGGGATGSWDAPTKHTPIHKPKSKGAPVVLARADPVASANESAADEVRTHETRNGYDFEIDSLKRTRAIDGTLTADIESERLRSAQRRAGGGDRLSTDDGGHYVALRFNGPRDAFNHFAQDANFNRGAYRVLENKLHKLARNGNTVRVNITPRFLGNSLRPARIVVNFTIDGISSSKSFSNSRGGK